MYVALHKFGLVRFTRGYEIRFVSKLNTKQFYESCFRCSYYRDFGRPL